MVTQTTCPVCKTEVSLTDFFCLGLRKKFKRKTAVNFRDQAGDEKSKKIGIAAIVLTVISIIITVWLSVGIINSIGNIVNSRLIPSDLGF